MNRWLYEDDAVQRVSFVTALYNSMPSVMLSGCSLGPQLGVSGGAENRDLNYVGLKAQHVNPSTL